MTSLAHYPLSFDDDYVHDPVEHRTDVRTTQRRAATGRKLQFAMCFLA